MITQNSTIKQLFLLFPTIGLTRQSHLNFSINPNLPFSTNWGKLWPHLAQFRKFTGLH